MCSCLFCISSLFLFSCLLLFFFFFFFNDTATTEIYTLSLHDALPISSGETGALPLSPNGLIRPPALPCPANIHIRRDHGPAHRPPRPRRRRGRTVPPPRPSSPPRRRLHDCRLLRTRLRCRELGPARRPVARPGQVPGRLPALHPAMPRPGRPHRRQGRRAGEDPFGRRCPARTHPPCRDPWEIRRIRRPHPRLFDRRPSRGPRQLAPGTQGTARRQGCPG